MRTIIQNEGMFLSGEDVLHIIIPVCLFAAMMCTVYVVRRKARLTQLHKQHRVFLPAFVQVRRFPKNKQTKKHITTCPVFSCDIYVCTLANTKLKVAGRFQVRNPNPDPSGSPRTGFLHCFPDIFHLVKNSV